MDHNAYQLLALGARYWFVLLAAVLVWRGAAALLHEHYQRKKLLKKLPDAGMVGEMRDIDNDRAYPLPREGVLGGGSACDIRLRGLRRRDINFAFVEGKGLLLTPCHSRGGVLLRLPNGTDCDLKTDPGARQLLRLMELGPEGLSISLTDPKDLPLYLHYMMEAGQDMPFIE